MCQYTIVYENATYHMTRRPAYVRRDCALVQSRLCLSCPHTQSIDLGQDAEKVAATYISH